MLDKESAIIVREVVTTLEVDHQWGIGEAISAVAEVIGETKATVFEAWLFGCRYGNPTI